MFNPLLTSFVCVADSGSFNQAAEKLYISSTAVIKQINSLEKHLDLKLFERTNHGIRLTAAGHTAALAGHDFHKVVMGLAIPDLL